MYERVILWSTPVFFLLIAVEAILAWRRRRAPYRVADAISSIALGELSTYAGVFGRVLGVGLYVAAYERLRLATLPADSPIVWCAALLAYDFLYYWNHRLGHEVNVLWASHVVHHQSEEFNLSTALRQSGTGFLLSWVFYVPMALAGFPPAIFLFVSLIDLLYQFWIHTEQIGSLGLFDRLFASPSNHRVHHAVNDRYIDRNYGGILIVWDRLFGTFQPECADEPVVFGTRDPLRSWNPLWANLHTYASIARESIGACRGWDRLRIWWRRPGWHPPGGAAAPSFQADGRPKYAPPLPRSLLAYCLGQSALTLALGTAYLAVAPRLSPAESASALLGLAVSLAVIGGLSEGRRRYVLYETLRLAVLAATAAVLLVGGSRVVALLAVGGAALALWSGGLGLGGRPAPHAV